MSSQFLAIFYLSELDHFIKEELQCEYFVRYMDDFLILSTDKERLRKIWRLLEQILKEEYLLKQNPKTEIFPCRRGLSPIDFNNNNANSGIFNGLNGNSNNNNVNNGIGVRPYFRLMIN